MTQIANAYAQGLYDLAKDEGLTETVLAELSALQTGFAQEPMFCRLLATPNLSKEERLSVVDNSFRDKVHPYVLNFLKILTQRGYAARFSACCQAYRNFYNADHGILPVKAVTAVAITPAQTERLMEKLTKITGKQVELTNVVDPACLGGVRLNYNGMQLDGTVKSRLEGVATLLKNTVI